MLARVLGDPALAAGLRERGLARARDFRWERTAFELSNAVEAVA
jgi:glycosyltransferase involved in cell wall biosynthesis